MKPAMTREPWGGEIGRAAPMLEALPAPRERARSRCSSAPKAASHRKSAACCARCLCHSGFARTAYSARGDRRDSSVNHHSGGLGRLARGRNACAPRPKPPHARPAGRRSDGQDKRKSAAAHGLPRSCRAFRNGPQARPLDVAHRHRAREVRLLSGYADPGSVRGRARHWRAAEQVVSDIWLGADPGRREHHRAEEGGASITLEPGGQFELSGAPLEHLHQTCAETGSHLSQLRDVAGELGIAFLGLGFSPLWSLEDMPIMPKGRYKIMRDYMGRSAGSGAR